MSPFKKPASINNIIFNKEVIFRNDMEHFTDILEINPIPNKSIVYKTITGIGATHSEAISERDSIIVLPHISILTSKQKHYEKMGIQTLAVYGKVTHRDIGSYLYRCSQQGGFVKFLTTPKGLDKIILVLNEVLPELIHTEHFFLLIDECHKVIQDAGYRDDLTELMGHFFKWKNKAMVSATPIPSTDPRFEEQGFINIKIIPEHDFSHKINVVQVDSLVNGLQKYFKKNPDNQYFIFFNSTTGIKALIEQCEINDNYLIFCSQESSKEYKLAGQPNSRWKVEEFKKFNFLTSSFFNGLDIELDSKPDVIILTDYNYKNHTVLDPFTDMQQIVGRFRKKSKDDVPYNKITHMNNTKGFTNPLSEDQALALVNASKFAYDQIDTLKNSLLMPDARIYFDHALATIKPYAKLLTKDKSFSYFLLDNYLDDERVNNYYKNPSALMNAYEQTKHFIPSYRRECYAKDATKKLMKRDLMYTETMNMTIANALLGIEEYKGLSIYYDQRREIEMMSPLIYNAFNRIGYARIKSLEFKRARINAALLKLDIEEGLNSMPVIDAVFATFRLNTYYPVSQIKNTIDKTFAKYNIERKGAASRIRMYFEYKEKWKIIKEVNTRCYVFTARKIFTVNDKNHS